MKASIGISPANLQAVATEMSKLLADEFLLYTKTRNAHWNVEGPDFHTKHVFLKSSMRSWTRSWTALLSGSVSWAILLLPR
ncbi:hypothetical protein ACQ86N_09250 [Puia sp. P3]|uniref:hypothetical protein n=1 Tax=Puia sp. P3 TaxID=3423952 RepID=UPI003D67B787